MKIGFSYSQCLLDLYEQKVDLDDVLVIIARTNFDVNNDDHWNNIWTGYTEKNNWSMHWWFDYKDKEKEFRDLTAQIVNEGKLHQPRQYGAWFYPSNIVWKSLAPMDLLGSVKRAKRVSVDKDNMEFDVRLSAYDLERIDRLFK